MDQTRVNKNFSENKTEGTRKVGSPRLRWLEGAENDLWKLEVE
jgi:hypothetical protein